jgi:hypothetical protein
MGGGARKTWTGSNNTLEEKKLSSIYPAVKVRKTSDWRDSRKASTFSKQPSALEEDKGTYHQQAAETNSLHRIAGTGISLKAPLQSCAHRKSNQVDRQAAASISERQLKPSTCAKPKGRFDSLCNKKIGTVASDVSIKDSKVRASSREGVATMDDAFGSQFLADEDSEHAASMKRKCTQHCDPTSVYEVLWFAQSCYACTVL